MTRPQSFSQMLKSGAAKDELMKKFALTEAQYNKVIACVEKSKRRRRPRGQGCDLYFAVMLGRWFLRVWI